AGGYANTNISTEGVSSSGTVNSYQGAFYGSYSPSAFYLQGLAGYAYNDNTMTRTISFPGVSSVANGSTSSNQFLGAVETGYAFPVAKAMSVTPFLGLQGTTANQASFTETGAGTLNDAIVGLASPLSPLARAGWAHEYADTARPMTASFAGAPGAGFTVDGAQMARNSAVVAVGATTKLTNSLSFLLRYDGDVNGSDNAHAVTGRLSLTW
ncbi:MAG: autotransporter outer membrane beta-barrel domain-containing protein, partial [Verrucomicrobia bacterium]|nr:autotransporter outer membrane beta-barrel domain-containing protein [Verrucomicrobiota bacterium]